MEKVAVFPVPDCACAMTSDPRFESQRVSLQVKGVEIITLDNWHDRTLLNGRWSLEAIGVDSAKEFSF